MKLYMHDNFINDNIPFLFNKEIIEYDMKDAGFSLTQEFNLLDKDKINYLSKLKKDKRKIEMGLIERNDKEYRDSKKEAFKLARQYFFEANNLEVNDIISIKKDAIFTTATCTTRTFGNFINFRPKNFYTSYIHLGKNLEFYYSPDKLDIKGISDDVLLKHNDYMIKFLKLYFRKMETEDNATVIEFMKRFISRYKRYELEVGYYRTFDHKSIYKLINDSDIFDEYWEEQKEDLDISYNYFNILIKLIQIPLWNKNKISKYKIKNSILIILLAMSDVINRTSEFVASRDIFDWRTVKYIFDSYGVIYLDGMPIKYQIELAKNIQNILKEKFEL